jgi:hypothetical protein
MASDSVSLAGYPGNPIESTVVVREGKTLARVDFRLAPEGIYFEGAKVCDGSELG